jgi:hypothetical protein
VPPAEITPPLPINPPVPVNPPSPAKPPSMKPPVPVNPPAPMNPPLPTDPPVNVLPPLAVTPPEACLPPDAVVPAVAPELDSPPLSGANMSCSSSPDRPKQPATSTRADADAQKMKPASRSDARPKSISSFNHDERIAAPSTDGVKRVPAK